MRPHKQKQRMLTVVLLCWPIVKCSLGNKHAYFQPVPSLSRVDKVSPEPAAVRCAGLDDWLAAAYIARCRAARDGASGTAC